MSNQDYSANNCFVCGPDNPIGLRIQFHMHNDICHGSFTPSENHMVIRMLRMEVLFLVYLMM